MTAASSLLWSASARADDVQPSGGRPLPVQRGAFSLKIEPGLAVPLTEPQSTIYDTGGSQTLKALWSVGRYLDLGPSLSVVMLPSGTSGGVPGNAWTYGGSLRVKRPHDAPDDDKANGLSPWADVDALYVRTGGLNRAGFAAAAGLAVPIGRSRAFWLGPFVRYLQIFQGDRAGFNSDDAKILSLGISLEVGAGIDRERERLPDAAPPIAGSTITTETFTCPDRDQDGIPDGVDHCPDVAGPMNFWGCPAYKRITVGRDRLELKEKLFFAWDQAILQEESFPVLDEVVQALKENKTFRVQVEGHTSSEGEDSHNQTLSERRASAVLDYLVAHGISKTRLTSKGLASSDPTDTNSTISGRENNRRVDFVVNFTILNDGSKK